jgi:TonB family protein
MNKFLLPLCLLPALLSAQQRVYYNALSEVTKDTSNYKHYEDIAKQENGGVYVKRYNDEHFLVQEGAFSEYDATKRSPEGLHKQYRPTGELWYTQEFIKGERNGELRSYYPSGTLKRVENYINNQRTDGECFSEDGSAIAFTPLEQRPEYPGGEEALMQFISQEVQYPLDAMESGITGTAVISFVINKEGAVQDIRILKDPGGGCGREATRVVQSMPLWTPGYMDDQPVKVRYSLPIKFNLESGRKKKKRGE